MIIKNKIFHKNFLYIFFTFLSLNIFFFSTVKVEGKAFNIEKIEISQPFEIDFNKSEVLDIGFKKGFSELISLIVTSVDQKKINQTKLNEIKGMIETFSIKQEKFIDETYYVTLGVSFSKKKVLKFLESNNIFPSIPIKQKILFIPIIIDENKKDLLIFSDNKIFNEWNTFSKSSYLLEYILPTEDLEDLNIIKNKFETIEQYDFKDITAKYDLKDSIVALIFKNEKEIRVLSRILIKDNLILRNQSFNNINIDSPEGNKKIINELKTIYEDFWKNNNLINTSIKLLINVKVDSSNDLKIANFEKKLATTDLIYDFYISKFDKNFVYFQIIFNGTPIIFLNAMSDDNYKFDTQNKIWILK